MPLLLRKLDRKASFYPDCHTGVGDVQADALSDLRTSGNELSFWLVQDDHQNLDRVVAALASARMKLDKLDYALIDRQLVDTLQIEIVKRSGVSLDKQANERWHQDLTALSGKKVLELAITIQEKAELVRVEKEKVRAAIRRSIDDGFIDSRDITEKKLRRDLALDLPDRTPSDDN